MAFPSVWINGAAVTFKYGATQYETEVAEVEEQTTLVGGEQVVMADGSVYVTPQRSMVTGLRITLVQGVSSSSLFLYLRDTASGSGTIIVTGTSSATPSASNPKYTYTTTGWTWPPLKFTPGGVDMAEAIFTVSGNPVKATS
jgi:hypothetical protein